MCDTFKKWNKAGHGCQMPETLLEGVIRLCSKPGDLVLDPICGSGTTPAVANFTSATGPPAVARSRPSTSKRRTTSAPSGS